MQAFIQALLATAAFPIRFIFFTICLVQQLCEVDPWYTPKRKFLIYEVYICRLLYFSWIFFEMLEFYEEFWRKVDKKDTQNFPLCVFVSIQTKEHNNRMESLPSVFQKQKRKTHEKIEFHNSVQDWVLTTIYWL